MLLDSHRTFSRARIGWLLTNQLPQVARTGGQRLTIFYSPRWGRALQSPWECTLVGKDGRSKRLLLICGTRRSTLPIAPSVKPKRARWIGLSGIFTLLDH